MSRVLQVNDVHTSDRPPRNRTEEYMEQSFAELGEVFRLAEKLSVDALLFPGDLFHYPQPTKVSHLLVQMWLDLFDFGIPVVVIPGNHDLPAGQIEAVHKAPIGVLGKHKNVTLLMPGDRFELPGGHSVVGVPYRTGSDAKYVWQAVGKPGGDAIVMYHGSVATRPNPFYPTIHPSEFEGLAPLVMYGHMHEPEKLFKGERTLVSNPGALSRGTLTDSDLTRTPQVALVELDDETHPQEMMRTGKGLKVSYIDVPNCKPAEEIFKVESADVKNGQMRAVQSFVEALHGAAVERITVEALVAKARELAAEDAMAADMAADVLLAVA